ncbi:MAG: alpha/beta fold hydrolase [Dermatophilaceae bacterium]
MTTGRVGRVAWSAAPATAAAAGLAAGSLGVASYVLRRFTSLAERLDDVDVVAVEPDAVELSLTDETVAPGLYGLWLDGGNGHARVGDVLAVDRAAGRVRRRLILVDAGELRLGRARWNIYHYGRPPDVSLGLPYEDVTYASELGEVPAWLVRGDPAGRLAGRNRWAVLVHGRGAQRQECLRAVPIAYALGITSLVISYRNDVGAPASPDRRYGFGLSEWRDVDAAMGHALAAGAKSLDLVGWSMGGAMVLQAAARSRYADAVRHVVLDAPVVDWADVIRHHVALGKVPAAIGHLAPHVLRSRGARTLVGVGAPLDLVEADWVLRSADLRHPTLLIHSIHDEFVPVGPSIALATARPDLVRFEPWKTARHTQEWNTEPERWGRVVRGFLCAEGFPSSLGHSMG